MIAPGDIHFQTSIEIIITTVTIYYRETITKSAATEGNTASLQDNVRQVSGLDQSRMPFKLGQISFRNPWVDSPILDEGRLITYKARNYMHAFQARSAAVPQARW